MKSRLRKQDFNNQIVEFFPKQKSRKSSHNSSFQSISQKLPKLYNKFHHNTIQPQKKIKRHKRSISSYDITDFESSKLRKGTKLLNYLSSKIDFFNQQNQKRLDIKKRKILIDLGIVRMEKDKIIPGRKESSVPAAMVKLLQNYLIKRTNSENLSEDYYVLGREV